jgi:catechol 2,3-dioxygenase-like lactoylglutathione lyase family enzyme
VFDHVTVRVSDREASRRFYETLLAPLGLGITHSVDHFDEWDDFGIAEAREDRPVTRRLHVAFVTPSREAVDEAWSAATAAGYASDGAPGPRPQYREDYYGGFVLDPDGNSAEAVHHGAMREGGSVDHLWLRVADVAASTAFYETIAPLTDLFVKPRTPERTQLIGETGSFSLVSGTPTQNVHIAFPAADNATVDEFHRTAVAAGYRDNGVPGERRRYHPGYYGAFVLDPDGNNVEAVCHNRA